MGVFDAPVGGFSTGACILWLSYLHPTTRYFEWGSGFTTRVADRIAAKVTSIEGSRSWYEKMRKHSFSDRTDLVYVDVGRTGFVSWPKNASGGREYIRSMNEKQDVVLVDGRWRVACAVRAFSFLEEGGRLMIHDFGRRQYHSLLLFYTKEEEMDSLAVLRKRKNVSESSLLDHERLFEKDPNR